MYEKTSGRKPNTVATKTPNEVVRHARVKRKLSATRFPTAVRRIARIKVVLPTVSNGPRQNVSIKSDFTRRFSRIVTSVRNSLRPTTSHTRTCISETGKSRHFVCRSVYKNAHAPVVFDGQGPQQSPILFLRSFIMYTVPRDAYTYIYIRTYILSRVDGSPPSSPAVRDNSERWAFSFLFFILRKTRLGFYTFDIKTSPIRPIYDGHATLARETYSRVSPSSPSSRQTGRGPLKRGRDVGRIRCAFWNVSDGPSPPRRRA